MRNIKSYETYSLNETMDMMFLPVDVIAGQKEVYDNLITGMRNKFSEFVDGGTQVIDETVKEARGKASQALSNAEKFFGKPAEKITYDDVMAAIEKEGITEAESFMDRFDRADPYGGHDEEVGDMSTVKGGPAQKALAFLQNIFAANLLSFGLLGSFLAWCFGIMGGPAMSMMVSIVAWIVIHLIRKLITTSQG
jgi:hypothetical protein